MRITVIGCSGSYPGPDSPASCYLLEADDADGRTWRVLLELGNGALGALHNYIDPLSVDGVLVSHLHPDHYMDLCGYYVLRRYGPQGPQRPIPVWGPAGIADRMAHAYGLPLDPGMREDFDFASTTASSTSARSRWSRSRSTIRCRRTGCGSAPTAPRSATAGTPVRARGWTGSLPTYRC